MNKKVFSRLWYYFRTGWSTYFAFIFGALNTLVVTYYLAVEKVPYLLEFFPTFTHYVGFAIIIGIPLLSGVGYLHFKRVPAYASEVDIGVEQNPYVFKLRPGYEKKVQFPMYGLLTTMLLKISQNEKLTEKEIEEIKKQLANIEHLSQGGWIDKPRGIGAPKDEK